MSTFVLIVTSCASDQKMPDTLEPIDRAIQRQHITALMNKIALKDSQLSQEASALQRLIEDPINISLFREYDRTDRSGESYCPTSIITALGKQNAYVPCDSISDSDYRRDLASRHDKRIQYQILKFNENASIHLSEIQQTSHFESKSFRCRSDLEKCEQLKYGWLDCQLVMVVCLAEVIVGE